MASATSAITRATWAGVMASSVSATPAPLDRQPGLALPGLTDHPLGPLTHLLTRCTVERLMRGGRAARPAPLVAQGLPG